MSTFYQPIRKAPLKYVTSAGEYKKINVVAIKGVNIPNSFDIPYVRGVVGLFNAIISRMMYFSIYDAKGHERQYPKAQEKVYFPAWQISDMINRCESQSFNILRSLERILDIHVSRAHERSGANTIRLSERAHEFLNIFTIEKLNEFIIKYEIESEDQYALKQIYNYRVVRPSDDNMDRTLREEYQSFIKNRRHRNFLHFCAQNNVTDEARIVEIDAHIDFLSSKQLEQLQSIKRKMKETPGKLLNWFHWKLLDLQQYITFMLKKDKVIKKVSEQIDETPNSLVINRNKTEGEQEKTDEVSLAHKKVPEGIHIQDIVQVATFWNIMANGRAMDPINELTVKIMESIHNIVKLQGKENVLQAIENTGNLHQGENMMHVIQFKELIKDSDAASSRFSKVLNYTEAHYQLSDEEQMSASNKKFKFKSTTSPVSYDNVPQFNSNTEAKRWFKENLNQM